MRTQVIDIVLTLAAFLVVKYSLVFAGVPFSGSVGVVAAVLVASWRLRVANQGWADMGLCKPKRLWSIPLFAVIIFFTIGVVYLMVLTPVLAKFGLVQGEITVFDYLRGNTVALVLTLTFVVWGTAAFGEEMIFRGLVMHRFAALLGHGKGAWWTAAVLQAGLFGLPHYYQGLYGVIVTGSIGFIMATAFLLFGRNLWALILAHGAVDTLSLVQIYQS